MDPNFKDKFYALVEEGMESGDQDTKEFAAGASLLLATEAFGPDVFRAFLGSLVENADSLKRAAALVKSAAEELKL